LALFRACGDGQEEFESLLLMGSVMQFLDGMEKKIEFHRQALVLAQSIGGLWEQALALSALGWDQRDPLQARAHWEEAIALFRQVDDWRNLVDILGILGYTVLLNGDVESAQKFLDEAFELNGQMNDKRGMEFILTGKSYIALMRGEYGQARTCLQENATALE
jgi:tetratricopeptide (TPR) repeat protein